MAYEVFPTQLPFVGRSKEIAQLVGYLEETKNGHGSIVFITGPVGIGKSRLLEIIENYAIAEEFCVLKGRGLDESSVPYLPFRDAFRQVPDLEVNAKIPIGIAMVNEKIDKNIETIDINKERYRIYEEYHQKIKTLVESRPLLIVIDDVQWADPETLNLLMYLSKFVSDEKFSIFCAYPDDILVLRKSKALQNMLEKIVGAKGIHAIKLEPLKIEETAVLLEALLQTWKIPSELLKVIYEKTEGNPLYIEEMAHVVITNGFYEPRTRKIKRELSELSVPETLVNLVKGRIETLPDNAKKLLSIAAILGRRFRYAHLQKLTEMPEEELLSLLELLVNGGYLTEEKGLGDTYRFSHNLFYEVSYGMHTGLRRKMLHEKAGKILEGEVEDELTLNLVATHYWIACNYQKCAEYSLMLAKKMLEKFAIEDAVSLAKRTKECIQLAKIKEPSIRIETHKLITESAIILAAWETAIENLIELRKLAIEIKDNVLEIEVVLKHAFVEQKRGNPHAALTLLSEAVEIAKDAQLNREMGKIYRSMGFVYEKRGDYLAAQSYYLKSIELCKKYEDEIEMAEVYHRYGTNLFMMGKIEEAEQYLLKCAEVRKKHNLLTQLANTYNNLGALYATIGENEKAVEHYTLAKEIFEKTHDIASQAFIYNNLGVIYHDAGNWEKAMEYYRKDFETNTKLGNKWEYLVSASNIGNLYKDMEDYARAKEFYKIVLDVAEELGEKRVSVKVLANLALVYAMEGSPENAELWIGKAVAAAEDTKSPEVRGAVYLSYGIIKRMLKQYPEAEESFNRCMELYTQTNAAGDIAALHFEIGVLEKEKGNIEKAREHFKAALDYFEKTHAIKWIEKIKKEMG
ncbi:MAG: DUF2791 family P-loop domain-containing protein [Thermoplasmata archaeon]|nr:DUF2791 family P-loop domain-containing protein [Thermoplasmata archaeon]